MAPMKAKAAVRAMSKGGIAEALANGCEVKKSVASKLLDTLASVATAEVKKTGVFTVPGEIEDSHEASNEGRGDGDFRQKRRHGE